MKPTEEQVAPYRFVLASDARILSWSYGRVVTSNDDRDGLFDPRIFGYEKDYACPCGRFSGDVSCDGQICSECGVRIGPACELTKTRFGHIQLCVPVFHPWDGKHVCSVIPVLPVGLRRDGPSACLSGSYGKIVDTNHELHRIVGKDECEYSMIGRYSRRVESLRERIRHYYEDLIGPRSRDQSGATLSELLFAEIASLGQDVQALARAIGLGIRIGTVV